MSITSVPKPENRSIELPSSKSEWSQIINNICMEFHKQDGGWQDKEAERVILGLKKQNWKVSSHCECSLIEHLVKERNGNRKGNLKGLREATGGDAGYWRLDEGATSGQRGGMSIGMPWPGGEAILPMLDIGRGGRLKGVGKGEGGASSEASKSESNDWSGVPPFSYIGISKPSCTPCCIWIAAYNSLGQQRFYTRGSYKKWTWPWGRPRFQSQQLEQYMVNILSNEYIQRLEQEGKLRNLSDSSMDSMEADSPWNPSTIADLASLLLAENF